MTSTKLESEQALQKSAQQNVDTITRLINERYAYLDALVKISETRFLPIDFEAKADRAIKIAEKTLENWK